MRFWYFLVVLLVTFRSKLMLLTVRTCQDPTLKRSASQDLSSTGPTRIRPHAEGVRRASGFVLVGKGLPTPRGPPVCSLSDLREGACTIEPPSFVGHNRQGPGEGACSRQRRSSRCLASDYNWKPRVSPSVEMAHVSIKAPMEELVSAQQADCYRCAYRCHRAVVEHRFRPLPWA